MYHQMTVRIYRKREPPHAFSRLWFLAFPSVFQKKKENDKKKKLITFQHTYDFMCQKKEKQRGEDTSEWNSNKQAMGAPRVGAGSLGR